MSDMTDDEKDKAAPPRKSEITVHYRESGPIVSESAAPTKIEADNMSLKTLQAALDPLVFPYIKKIEITFADK